MRTSNKEVIKTYMKKNYVPRKEIEMIKKAWKCNICEVKYMYEKILKFFFEIMILF